MSAREKTAGGPLGRAVGKAKEMAGSVLDRDDLQRKGRLQQVQTETEAEPSPAPGDGADSS
jgi:uncharacterized protein YjbJ (UPF0337 family)